MNPTNRLACLLLLALPLVLSACGSPAQDPMGLEAVELLDLLEGTPQHLNPDKYTEVEIGSFRVIQSSSEDSQPLYISFHLIGIVPAGEQTAIVGELALYEQRLRDAVITHIQRMDREQLAEPSLGYVKSETVVVINRLLQRRALRDVVFSDFCLGYEWPPESGGSEKKEKKPSGHH